MAYNPYPRLTFAKKRASDMQRPGTPYQISNETVMDYYLKRLHAQVMLDSRVSDTDRDAVVNVAKNDVLGLISGQGIKKIVDRAIAVACPSASLAKEPAPTIFIPHHEGIQLDEKRIERVVLKSSISEDVVRRQMRLMLKTISKGRSVSQNALNTLMKVLKPDPKDRIDVSTADPTKKKGFDAILILMLHVVEIEKNPYAFGRVNPSTWSHNSPQIIEAIKNADLDDLIVRGQLGIIALTSPFRKVRNAAERALKGQR